MTKKRLISTLPYFFFVIFSLVLFLKPFGNGDELWNYNFAKEIANGLEPYTDISMIQTPLSAYISSIFLVVFGKGLFSFRIAGVVLMTVTISVFYRLCICISKNKTISFVSTSFVFALHLIMWIYNYNYLTILLVLFTMMLYQKDHVNGKLIALIFGFLPLIKQNTGAILLLGFYIVCAIEIFVEKKEKKNVVINCLISVIPTFLYMLYLLLSGAITDFWEYAVLGIGQFTHRTSYFSLMFSNPLLFGFAIIPWLVYGRVIFDLIKNGYDGKKVKCFIISIATMSMAYPLCDTYHFCSAIIPSIPLFIMTLKPKNVKNNSAIVCNMVAGFIMFFAMLNSIVDFNEYTFSNIKNYENILISYNMQDQISTVDAYIVRKMEEGYKVYIADESAVAYTVPLDMYNKNWDMLLVGNVGLNSVEDLTSSTERCLYLVKRDETSLGKQSHYDLIHYIKENYSFVEEVLNFDVYEKD